MKAEERILKELFDKAHEAGMMAVAKANVVPMVVSQHANMMDDSSPVEKSWYVADGVCGFAWITIRPGTSKAARYAKNYLGARAGYYGGMEIWVSKFNQSMQKKETYAHAFAEVLQSAGIKAYSGSRMD